MTIIKRSSLTTKISNKWRRTCPKSCRLSSLKRMTSLWTSALTDTMTSRASSLVALHLNIQGKAQWIPIRAMSTTKAWSGSSTGVTLRWQHSINSSRSFSSLNSRILKPRCFLLTAPLSHISNIARNIARAAHCTQSSRNEVNRSPAWSPLTVLIPSSKSQLLDLVLSCSSQMNTKYYNRETRP